ncbi:MAG: class I SAM-dependent DNA methyltransferase [Clostridiaceae bacterium]|jgi:type I restriction-modification system DNA methylase subunit|nr:class I SAM-dependent DNA methyltransferase [Clostridiaceae bacterium]
MTDVQKRTAAAKFAKDWAGRGKEKGESQPFWLALLRNIFGVESPEHFIKFEEKVILDHASFIDGFIESTHVLIEQKSLGKNLKQPIRQSDGSLLTPFQQAKRYSANLPYSQRPRWIVICNFEEFHIYDMEQPNNDPESLLLSNLPKEYDRLKFLVDKEETHIQKEMEVSLQAGELVGALYDALLPKYANPESPKTLKSLNMLCVRLVFCLYAEDASIFGGKTMFHDYLKNHRSEDRRALVNLFRTLDQDIPCRDPYMDDDLAAFPYVNGGLFADENIEIPRLGDEVIDLILSQASEAFDWSEISPTIFGAVFESTLNPETRRAGGMHYTSIENIHKVIDPLFLNELEEEFQRAMALKTKIAWKNALERLQDKLASLKFLDPACGSGNFLTETYLSLRRLENRIILAKAGDVEGQVGLEGEFAKPIRVSIGQFYGIEINDFAVSVARTALWIAENQMLKQTEDIIHQKIDFLPLKSYATITEANALRLDWETVVPKQELNYIMGNPPFVGARLMSAEQKKDLNAVFEGWKNAGNLDYVCCWYKKAADLIAGAKIRAALVSTNSVTQGESVANLWKPLFESGVHIDFAHRTFRWDSEAKIKAHVHCVVVGFSVAPNNQPRRLFTAEREQLVSNINAYLLDAPTIFIENRTSAISKVPPIHYGSFALDNGNYTIKEKEYDVIAKDDPAALSFMRPFVGAQELLHGQKRYCIWLKDISPSLFIKNKTIMGKIEKVKTWRENSSRKTTKELAATPALFAEIRQPTSSYLAIPTVCSESRKYIPMAYLPADIVASNQLYIVEHTGLYHFGVLTSNVHMAWVRVVCGRLEMRYRYSSGVVYNNFPWPSPSPAQRARIEQTAQAILDARARYPECSLADLYAETAMPPDLRTAHQKNDRAVMEAYGFTREQNSESACVAQLMKLYQELVEKEKLSRKK